MIQTWAGGAAALVTFSRRILELARRLFGMCSRAGIRFSSGHKTIAKLLLVVTATPAYRNKSLIKAKGPWDHPGGSPFFNAINQPLLLIPTLNPFSFLRRSARFKHEKPTSYFTGLPYSRRCFTRSLFSRGTFEILRRRC